MNKSLKAYSSAECLSWSGLNFVPYLKTPRISNRFRRGSDRESASLTKEGISS